MQRFVFYYSVRSHPFEHKEVAEFIEQTRKQMDIFEKLLLADWQLNYIESSEETVYYDLVGSFDTPEEALQSLLDVGIEEYDLDDVILAGQRKPVISIPEMDDIEIGNEIPW